MRKIQLFAKVFTAIAFLVVAVACSTKSDQQLVLNEKDYFEARGVNFIVFTNWYAGLFGDEKMSGVEVIHHGTRTVTNGDVRLDPTPDQWGAIPTFIERVVDHENQTIEARLHYPDYDFHYSVIAKPHGETMLLSVKIDKPVPDELVGRAAFHMEFLPSSYFEKSYLVDQKPGSFPLYPSGPMKINDRGEREPLPLAKGVEFVLSPDDPETRVSVETKFGQLELFDGRNIAQNGWYVLQTLLPANKTGVVVEWEVTVHGIENWVREPMIAYSQLGYHPDQEKVAVVELDTNDKTNKKISLMRIDESGNMHTVKTSQLEHWGHYLRYNYGKFDFSDVSIPGLYCFKLDDIHTKTFRIDTDIYETAWQPALDVYMPVQMDHMFVREAYRVWHGRSHMDDALQAPVDHEHFDLYAQGPTTDTDFEPFEHIPGLNVGGWYDAGDFDLRTQTQYQTITYMVDAWERFGIDRDNTLVDRERGYVEIHHPDGKPDLLQQIEHGVLALIAQYHAIGNAIPGIIMGDIRQYTHLGDAVTITDNKIFNPKMGELETDGFYSGVFDDRWAFTSKSTPLNYGSASSLAASSRALKGYNDELADECLSIAMGVWELEQNKEPDIFYHGNTTGGPLELEELRCAVELLLATGNKKYTQRIYEIFEGSSEKFDRYASLFVKAIPYMNENFKDEMRPFVAGYAESNERFYQENPFGVPITRGGWAGGGSVMRHAITNYILHREFPEIVSPDATLNGLNFILGCHPASNVSFVSGIGTVSKKIGYGMNRADYSFIAGGVVPGVVITPPDFPENQEEWPFFWGHNEYVIPMSMMYMYLVHAVDDILN